MLDFNDPKQEVQEWMIAYKKEEKWHTFVIPGEIKKDTVERVIVELNEKYEITFSRKIMGVFEPGKNNHYKKGEFL